MVNLKKAALILFTLVGLSIVSTAQNTFPSSGNAGVGTTNPETLVHIKSPSSNSSYGLKIEGYQGFSSGLRLQNNTTTTGKSYSLYSANDGDFILGDETTQKVKMAIWNSGQFAFNGDAEMNGMVRTPVSFECGNGSLDWGQRHFVLSSFSYVARFAIGLQGDEGPGNIGGDFSIWRYGNNGEYLDKAFVINRNTGYVGIGIASPKEKLSVNGTILAKKVRVSQGPSDWPDYVFDCTYKLPSLDSISSFIKANKHLPEMPSAATVEKDGQDVGEIQKLLLKKVEELTLYVIELKKENEEIKMEIQSKTKGL